MPEFFTLVSPDEARNKILAHTRAIADAEEVMTADAMGRVLSEDMASPQILPEFRERIAVGRGQSDPGDNDARLLELLH